MPLFEHIKGFRFWCHKVIPLIYDDSLSYYEFLCKVMQKLNEVIELLNAHSEEIERFETDILAQFEAFKAEVQAKIQAFENLFVEDFSEDKNYLTGDYVLENDTLYTAREDITAGPFDSTKWDAVIFATDFANWRREMNARVANFIAEITAKLQTWLENIAEPFSATKLYRADDIVSRNDKLYKRNTAGQGTFDLDDWTQIVLANWYTERINALQQYLDMLTREKANTTDAYILNKEKHEYALMEGVDKHLMEPSVESRNFISVYVISPKATTTAQFNEMKEKLVSLDLYEGASETPLISETVTWIANTAFVRFPPFTVDNGSIAMTLSEGLSFGTGVYVVTRYEVDVAYQYARPYPTAYFGAGFVDVNNLAMDYLGYQAWSQTSINVLRNDIDNTVQPKLNLLDGTKAVKDIYGLRNTLPYSGTRIDSFDDNSTYSPSTPGPVFYVHALTEESTELLYNQSGFITFQVAFENGIVGIGTTPAEAFSNAISTRRIETQTGTFWYVPLERSRLTTGQRVFIFRPADATITSVSGVAIITTGLLDGIGDNQGQFGDVPLQDLAIWLDGRVSTTEEQLGGYSIVALTQAEYDALVAPDAHTIYVITG